MIIIITSYHLAAGSRCLDLAASWGQDRRRRQRHPRSVSAVGSGQRSSSASSPPLSRPCLRRNESRASIRLDAASSAAVLVWENTWAAPFASAVRRSGGQLVAGGPAAETRLSIRIQRPPVVHPQVRRSRELLARIMESAQPFRELHTRFVIFL